jgi:hypothetical protein
LIVRTGASGGRNGHLGRTLRFSVIDVDPTTFVPLSVFVFESEGNDLKIQRSEI